MSGAAIPDGWELVDLGKLGVFAKGAGIRKDEALSGEIPAVRYGELYTDHPEILRAHRSFISAEISKSARPIKCGDILFAGSGETKEEIGKCTGFLGDYEAFAGGDIIIFRPSSADFRFLSYLLNSRPIAQQKAQRAQGDAVVHIYPDALAKLLLPLPPLHEQQAIAAALSDADGVVAGLEQVIAKKRLIKQGAMQDLLTARRRLPGFSGEWAVKQLGSLGVGLRGVSYDGSADLFEAETPDSVILLRSNNVQNGEVVYSDVQHVRKERVKPVQHLKRGDVLVCMANGSRALVGKAGVFWEEDGSAYTFGAFMGCFRPIAGAAADGYVPFLFQSDEYRNFLNVILSGSAINNLAPSQISTFSFKMPVDHSEQKAIAAVLSDMDAEIQTLESRLTKARAVKEGMMQNLLTGRVRLV